MTSQNLWSRHHRSVVDRTTWHDVWSLKAKIRGVIHRKLSQLFYENAHTTANLPTKRVFKRYFSNQHFSEFYLQDGGENRLAYRYGTKSRHCHPVYSCCDYL